MIKINKGGKEGDKLKGGERTWINEPVGDKQQAHVQYALITSHV